MSPFDIEKAKAGAPVCTRDGNKQVRILCYNLIGCKFPVIAAIYRNGQEWIYSYTEQGKHSPSDPTPYINDLFMVDEKPRFTRTR